MRRALIVGIDDYPMRPLKGCVNDANKMRDILKTHHDGSPNFDVWLLTTPDKEITKDVLYERIIALFAQPADIALFYFSGHGVLNALGGHLVTQDSQAGQKYEKGVGMTYLLELAREGLKHIDEIIIFLDCCNSGEAGNMQGIDNDSAVLGEGLSI